MIVEIGTCDFETAAGKEDGLFVEPIKTYFDRLPPCRKENVAVSNYTGDIDIYYVPEALILAHGLPGWLRGCNSVGAMHPQHLRLPKEWVARERVPVVRLADLLAKHAIDHVDVLRIDTEGHDAVIVNDLLDTCSVRPKSIVFENNGLVPPAEVDTLLHRLRQHNYRVLSAGYNTEVIDIL